ISEEHRFSNHLLNRGMQVAPYFNAAGDTLVEQQGFFVSVQQRLSGRSPELFEPDTQFELGQLIGRLHVEASGFEFHHRQGYDPITVASISVALLHAEHFPKTVLPALYAGYQALLDLAKARYEQVQPGPFVGLHGDCHLSNILISQAPGLVDFDDCQLGPAIQDMWMLLSGELSEQRKQLVELIEGYEEYCAFDRTQLALIPALRALRFINYTAWLARRWSEPAFKQAFPWFASEHYWAEQVKETQRLINGFEESYDLVQP
ncbi:MAG: serine/threonine protein kinase, partial [Pseudomonadales bacterium]